MRRHAINIPREYDEFGRPDGYLIRRHAIDHGVPLVTDLQLARALVEALRWRAPSSLAVLAWNDYVGHDQGAGSARLQDRSPKH